jgi:hypothetical protein
MRERARCGIEDALKMDTEAKARPMTPSGTMAVIAGEVVAGHSQFHDRGDVFHAASIVACWR